MGGNVNPLDYLVRSKSYTFLETIGHDKNLSIVFNIFSDLLGISGAEYHNIINLKKKTYSRRTTIIIFQRKVFFRNQPSSDYDYFKVNKLILFCNRTLYSYNLQIRFSNDLTQARFTVFSFMQVKVLRTKAKCIVKDRK